jgi:hypothetical protein
MYRIIGRLMAALSALVGIGFLFGMAERLGTNRGRSGNFGDLFLGLAGFFGEIPARLLLSGSFFLLAWLFWKAQIPKSRQKRDESK